MKKITARQLMALTAADDSLNFRETGGLVGKVRSGKRGITVQFRYEYKINGVKKDNTLGSWPKKSLADIRAERDRMRAMVADGIDPVIAIKAARIEAQQAIEATIAEAERKRTDSLTVKNLFEEWIDEGVARKDNNAELLRKFPKDVLPAVGHIELSKLTDGDIRTMLRSMISRGVTRLAISTFDDITQMLAWGEKRKPWRGLLVDGNPAQLVNIENLIPDDYEEERDRILSPAEILELHNIFRSMEDEYKNAPNRRSAARPMPRKTQLALWICLGSLCRIGELLQAEWQHIDFDTGVWFIPSANVKGTRLTRQEHRIFMSDFVRRQFQELKGITGKSQWCFPAKNRKSAEPHVCLKSVSKSVGDRQERFKNRKPLLNRRHDNTLVLAGGINGDWTPHDLRRTGATKMQALGVTMSVIDRCQNHVLEGPPIRRTYLHYQYHKEQSDAWNQLGEWLDEILNCNSDVIEINTAQIISG